MEVSSEIVSGILAYHWHATGGVIDYGEIEITQRNAAVAPCYRVIWCFERFGTAIKRHTAWPQDYTVVEDPFRSEEFCYEK